MAGCCRPWGTASDESVGDETNRERVDRPKSQSRKSGKFFDYIENSNAVYHMYLQGI